MFTIDAFFDKFRKPQFANNDVVQEIIDFAKLSKYTNDPTDFGCQYTVHEVREKVIAQMKKLYPKLYPSHTGISNKYNIEDVMNGIYWYFRVVKDVELEDLTSELAYTGNITTYVTENRRSLPMSVRHDYIGSSTFNKLLVECAIYPGFMGITEFRVKKSSIKKMNLCHDLIACGLHYNFKPFIKKETIDGEKYLHFTVKTKIYMSDFSNLIEDYYTNKFEKDRAEREEFMMYKVLKGEMTTRAMQFFLNDALHTNSAYHKWVSPMATRVETNLCYRV